MKKLIAFLLLAATLNFSIAAQQNQTPVKKDEQSDSVRLLMEFNNTLAKRVNFADTTGNALTRMEETRAVALDYPPETKPQEYYLLATLLMDYAAKLGNYADAVRYGDFGKQKFPLAPSKGDALNGFKPVPAIEAISQAAEKSQVVMINEAHHVPQHRALTIELLTALKKKGYKYFAAEMLLNGETELTKPDAEINKRGYPVKQSLTYGSEPVAGDMLRTALRLGYTLVPYDIGFTADGKPVGPAARERGATANLKERIFKNDPNAKVLIHVGFGHNSEADEVYNGKALAGYIKELLGIDPLTVDQTVMSERSATEYERPLYRFVADRKDFTRPTVFRNFKGEFFTIKDRRDITVFSPRSIYRNDRPHWLALGGTRREYILPPDVCRPEKHCLVRARFADESADAIPIDQIEARAAGKNALLLPKGNFIIEAEDAKGRKVKTWRIKK